MALKAEAVSEPHLANWHKSHPFKVALACRLRKETTVTVEWLAQRLKMGSRGYLAHLLKHPPGAESPNQPLLGASRHCPYPKDPTGKNIGVLRWISRI